MSLLEMIAVLGDLRYYDANPNFDPFVASEEKSGDGFGVGYGWTWGDGNSRDEGLAF